MKIPTLMNISKESVVLSRASFTIITYQRAAYKGVARGEEHCTAYRTNPEVGRSGIGATTVHDVCAMALEKGIMTEKRGLVGY